ncbi:MAG: methylated-DNA--[protein]-cysteine S-methyltransferase [Planctomycetota bacterium]
MSTARIASPVGTLTLQASAAGLVRTDFTPAQTPDEVVPPELAAAADQLAEYFSGNRTSFDLPLDLRGTDFQRSVWLALLEIPFGATRSYADIARAIGNPKAVRAVGLANGRNPVSVIVPCHRVIGADGSLTGYGGGVDRKRTLLAHEGVRGFAQPPASMAPPAPLFTGSMT